MEPSTSEATVSSGVDKDKDVDYRTNEEEGLVVLDITLFKRGKDIGRGSVP